MTTINRTEQIKSFLTRLGAGEDLEAVRADFVREFDTVEAAEIMQAEQQLLADGTPLAKVQRLCDVHSALFHGTTQEERIANAEAEVMQSLARQTQNAAPVTPSPASFAAGRTASSIPAQQAAIHAAVASPDAAIKARAKALGEIAGHPLRTLMLENEALAALLAEANQAVGAASADETSGAGAGTGAVGFGMCVADAGTPAPARLTASRRAGA